MTQATEMIEVTRDQFFAAIGPQDVIPQPHKMHTVWETRRRELVGQTTPGYLCEGRKAYFLKGGAA
mgnify:CR=1 FL=1|tara:strand:- start:90 stop:287 length:198 start_codon:yes stop_codon:yes gene_type:complete